VSLERYLVERLAAGAAALAGEHLDSWPGREFMDTREAANFLRISQDYFKKPVSEGKIARHAVSERNYVYTHSELLEWVKSRPADGLLLDWAGIRKTAYPYNRVAK